MSIPNKKCYFENYDKTTRGIQGLIFSKFNKCNLDTTQFHDGFTQNKFNNTFTGLEGVITGEFGAYDSQAFVRTIYQGQRWNLVFFLLMN